MKLQGLVKVCAAMLFCLLSNQQLLAQQLKLGTNPTLLDKNALLELKSDKQGFLLPRIIKAQILAGGALYNAAEGMLVYITDDKALYLKKTTGWEKIDFSILTAGTGIDITGNSIKNIGVTSFKTRTGDVLPAIGDYALTQLSDVTITSPVNNQLLQYQSGKWINTTLSYVPSSRQITFSGGTGIAAVTAAPAGTDLSADRIWTITADNTTAIWNADKIRDKNILATAPNEGDLLTFTGGNWTPKAAPTGGATLPSGSVWQINQGGTGIGWIGAAGTVLTVGTDGKLTYSNQFLGKNDNIILNGDVTGTGNSYGVATTLSNTGITAGTYTKIQVDAKGRATYGTTLGTADLPNNIPLAKLENGGAANGQVLKYNGTAWAPANASSAGVATINTLTAADQLLRPLYTAGTTSYGFTSATATHTLTIADASATIGGLVNIVPQTFKGAKTFNDGIVTSTLRINTDVGNTATKILGKDANGDVSSLTTDTTLTINTTTKQLGAKNTTNMWNANKIQKNAVIDSLPGDGDVLKWNVARQLFVPAQDITGGASYGNLTDNDITYADAPDPKYRMKIWASPTSGVVTNGPAGTSAWAWSVLSFQNTGYTTQLYFDKNTLALREWKNNTAAPPPLIAGTNPWYKVVTIQGDALLGVGGLIFGTRTSDSKTEIAQDSVNLFWDNSAKELGIKTNTPNSTLHVNGSVATNIRTVTSSITAQEDDYTILVNNGGTVTITLPAPSTTNKGRIYIVKKVSNNTNTLKVVSSAAIDFNAVATGVSTTAAGTKWGFQSDGVKWWIIN